MPPRPHSAVNASPSVFRAHDATATADEVSRLRTGRLRVTSVRVAMLAALRRHSTPITLRQLQSEMGAKPIAFVTLFRCMRRFEQARLVRRTISFDGAVCWALYSSEELQAFHVTDSDTGTVTALDPDSSVRLRQVLKKIDALLQYRGYTSIELHLAFHGVKAGSQPALAASRRQIA